MQHRLIVAETHFIKAACIRLKLAGQSNLGLKNWGDAERPCFLHNVPHLPIYRAL